MEQEKKKHRRVESFLYFVCGKKKKKHDNSLQEQ